MTDFDAIAVGRRVLTAEADALKRPENQEPAEGRRERHRCAKYAEDD